MTRDRVSAPVSLGGRYVELVDTGGIGIEDADNLTSAVERQIDEAIRQAAVVLFVVDIRAGLTPLDAEIDRRLRARDKPVILVANKCDSAKQEPLAAEFFALGRGRPIAVSAEHHRGGEALTAAILRALPDADAAPPPEPHLKLAIVGRRNVGKSTFVNSLSRAERMIVSEVPGTTRDSVDVRFERDGLTFVAIDTAGVRKKKSLASDIEFYSLQRAQRSIRRADVVLMFLDPRVRISHVDKAVTEYILDQHKPAIFVVNKWDLAKNAMPTERYVEYLHRVLPMLDYVPVAFITAKSGKNVFAVLNLAQHLHKQAGARVSTGDLNRVVREALESRPPPLRQNRRPKVLYATQAATHPPTIVLFTNGPQLFDPPYRRYLLSVFRDRLPFREVPIKLQLRGKRRGEEPPSEDAAAAEAPAAARSPRRNQAEAKRRPTRRRSPSVSDGDGALWRDV